MSTRKLGRLGQSAADSRRYADDRRMGLCCRRSFAHPDPMSARALRLSTVQSDLCCPDPRLELHAQTDEPSAANEHRHQNPSRTDPGSHSQRKP